jgi:hypothetical protein
VGRLRLLVTLLLLAMPPPLVFTAAQSRRSTVCMNRPFRRLQPFVALHARFNIAASSVMDSGLHVFHPGLHAARRRTPDHIAVVEHATAQRSTINALPPTHAVMRATLSPPPRGQQRLPGSSRRRVGARAAQPEQPGMLLPNALWLSADASSMPVYGQQFVIQREAAAPPPPVTQQDCLDASLSAALGGALPLVYSQRPSLGLVQVAASPPADMVLFEEPGEEGGVIDVEPLGQRPAHASTPFIHPLGHSSALVLPPSEVRGCRLAASPPRTGRYRHACCGGLPVGPRPCEERHGPHPPLQPQAKLTWMEPCTVPRRRGLPAGAQGGWGGGLGLGGIKRGCCLLGAPLLRRAPQAPLPRLRRGRPSSRPATPRPRAAPRR